MYHRKFLIAGAICSTALLVGCGGSTTSTSINPLNGLYRTALSRGNSSVTVYVNAPAVEIVVTDEAGKLASFSGSSATALDSTSAGNSFTGIGLNGSDGEVAQASGSFATTSGVNALTLSLTGGVGLSTTFNETSTSTNTLMQGTYSGTFTSSYTLAGVTSVKTAGTVSKLTLAPDSTTGGYDLNATGTTTDPQGNTVSFTITNGQVDPCGIITGMTIVYSYAGGLTPSVTNTYSTAYANLGVVSATTLNGLFQATTTNWTGGAYTESDALTLTQSSTGFSLRTK